MKKVFLGIFVVLVVIVTFFTIENGGFINRKLNFIANLEEESQKALDQSEYVILKNDSVLHIHLLLQAPSLQYAPLCIRQDRFPAQ